jgi:hypothetical protein
MNNLAVLYVAKRLRWAWRPKLRLDLRQRSAVQCHEAVQHALHDHLAVHTVGADLLHRAERAHKQIDVPARKQLGAQIAAAGLRRLSQLLDSPYCIPVRVAAVARCRNQLGRRHLKEEVHEHWETPLL